MNEPTTADLQAVEADMTEDAVSTAEAAETVDTTNSSKQVVISVVNPTVEEMTKLLEQVKVNHDFNVVVKPVNFNFKKSTDKDTGIETVRNTVQLPIPYPSVEGIIEILSAEDLDAEGKPTGTNKQLDLLIDAIEGIVNTQVRDLLYEDTNLSAANFPLDKITWQFISLIPKAQRRGGGIPKEIWEEFVKDYVTVMPEATGKTIDQVTAAARILANKLALVKTNKPVLELIVSQLAIYVETSELVEEFQECVAFLLTKAETFLNVKPEELLANL